jgi:hypothetical protein
MSVANRKTTSDPIPDFSALSTVCTAFHSNQAGICSHRYRLLKVTTEPRLRRVLLPNQVSIAEALTTQGCPECLVLSKASDLGISCDVPNEIGAEDGFLNNADSATHLNSS